MAARCFAHRRLLSGSMVMVYDLDVSAEQTRRDAGPATQAMPGVAFYIGTWCSPAASRVRIAVVARSNRAVPTIVRA